MKKIRTLIDNALEFASKQEIKNTMLLFQVLKAKLAIFEHKFDVAISLLERIKNQACNLGYKQIKKQCDKEIERINERNLLDMVLDNLQEDEEKQTNGKDHYCGIANWVFLTFFFFFFWLFLS